ncbi:hypothetical protein GCM10027422_07530 [Hymenobacter arcticus]
MKAHLLLALVLLPSLAHADALSAYGAGLAFFALLMLGVTLLVVIGFLFVIYNWPRWSGVPYVLGVPLLVLTWVRLQADYPGQVLNSLWLLVLLLNGLVWVQAFRPRPIRLLGTLAILTGSIGIVSTLFDFPVLPPYHHSEYAAEPAPPPERPVMPAVSDKVYTYVEDMPKIADIKSLIEQRLVLPPKTQRGHVFVQFVVTKAGVVRHPQIVKGLRSGVDSAVVAAVRHLPALAPSTQYGQPVNVSFTISVDVGKE